ncbi:hypothetical protein [Polaribacter sp.]|uniref:beta strand repeat-containing protein n=1 Tax=Polaribacter sp. TaxID=1920175 RepID=UPI0025E1FC79|nr:hypothetical protein [Polaribacter sp.]
MKKLFSYLLISSMVVLSSCTNYDDQFDDLNTQINTLKSQIEGFSSLSSGLTALQGTVASLQTAIANIPVTPATDISGLESTQAALQAGLTSLADAVADLQTSLASAATAAEVAALSTSLAAVQADLDDLLASNNIYSTAISITTNSELDFAVALGDKVNIVNAAVVITQSKDMDAAKLAGVMAKFRSVTGNVTYTATETGITSFGEFTNLTAGAVVTIDQKAPVSLPALSSATTLDIKDNTGVTSVSVPNLETVTTLSNLTFTKATSLDLSSLTRYASDLTISVKSGKVNLDSFVTTTTATNNPESGKVITVSGASEVVAPLITGGKLIMDSVLEPNFPVWKGANSSAFAKATKVVLPSITGQVTINLNTWAPKATYFHYIGLDGDDATSTADDKILKFPSFDTGAANGNLETLIVGGSSTSVDVDGATDLTSFTITGSTHALTVNNNDALTSLTLGHTSKVRAISAGSLVVTGNENIESITADSLDDISTLTISSNPALETLSFAALNSLGTKTDGKALGSTASISITGNALAASLIQLPSPTGTLPAVAGKVTTASGLTAMKTYISANVAAAAGASKVTIDDVANVKDHLGADYTGTVELATNTAASAEQTWSAENDPINIVDIAAGTVSTAAVAALKQKNTYSLVAGSAFDANEFIAVNPNGTELAKYNFTTANTGAITGYVASDITTWASAVEAELQSQIDNNGADYTVSIVNDWGRTSTYDINMYLDGSLSATAGAAGKTLTFTFDGTQVGTVESNNDDDLASAIARAINAGDASDTWSAATASGPKVVVTPLIDGQTNYNYTGSFPNFSFPAYSVAASLTSYLELSNTIRQDTKVDSKGWRITVQNDTYAINAANLNRAETASMSTASGIALTELVAGTTLTDSQTNIQADFSKATAGSSAVLTGTKTVNLTSWM